MYQNVTKENIIIEFKTNLGTLAYAKCVANILT